jgi:hypothetical protein
MGLHPTPGSKYHHNSTKADVRIVCYTPKIFHTGPLYFLSIQMCW